MVCLSVFDAGLNTREDSRLVNNQGLGNIDLAFVFLASIFKKQAAGPVSRSSPSAGRGGGQFLRDFCLHGEASKGRLGLLLLQIPQHVTVSKRAGAGGRLLPQPWISHGCYTVETNLGFHSCSFSVQTSSKTEKSQCNLISFAFVTDGIFCF